MGIVHLEQVLQRDDVPSDVKEIIRETLTEHMPIEWISKLKLIQEAIYEPKYGNLSDLNTNRLLLDLVGADTFNSIVSELLNLIETSAAVYESNGDYAIGIFSSSWCRFLDQASRDLCETDDNRKALECGKWYCHESCWTHASKVSIETGEPVDIECYGGIRIYAIPIWANEVIIGSINFGYGNPPQDPQKLHEIAERYKVRTDELADKAKLYEPRCQFIIESAKIGLSITAKLIGRMIEQKQTEEELIKTKLKLEYLLTSNPAVIYSSESSDDYRMTFISENVKEMTGYEAQEFLADPKFLDDRIHPEDREGIIASLSEISNQDNYQGIYRFLHKNGSYRWMLEEAKLIFDEQENPVERIGYWTDITKRMQTEEALRASEERLRAFMDSSPDLYVLLDQNLNYFEANEAALKIFQKTKEEVIGRNILDLNPELEETERYQKFLEVVKTGKPFFMNDLTPHHKFGDLHLSMRAFKVGVGLGVIYTNINEGKQAEDELRRSEQRYRKLFEQSPVSLWEEDFSQVLSHLDSLKESGVKDFRKYFAEHPAFVAECASLVKVLDVNQATLDLYKAKNKDELTESLHRVFVEESYDTFREELIALAEGATKFSIETTGQNLKGEKIYAELGLSLVDDFDDRSSRILLSILDVTDRNQAQDELKRANERLEHLLTSNPAVIYSSDPSSNYQTLFISKNVKEMTGYEPQIFLDSPHFWEKQVHPDDRIFAIKNYNEISNKGTYNEVYRFQHKNGSYIWVHEEAKVIQDEQGNLSEIIGYWTDITKLKQAEIELSESEVKFKSIFEAAPVGIEVFDENGILIDANQSCLDMFGVSNINEVKGLVLFEDPNIPEEKMIKLKKGNSVQFESVFDFDKVKQYGLYKTSKSGRMFVDVAIQPLEITNQNISAGYLVHVQDISERKQAEEDLREKKERLRAFMDSATDSFYLLDSRLNVIDVNENVLKVLRLKIENVIGKNIIDLDPSLEKSERLDKYKEVIKTGQPLTENNVIPHPRYGQKYYVAKFFKVGDGLGIIRTDVTERLRAEEALRESESKSRAIFEAAPIGIGMADLKGNVLAFNQSILDVTGYNADEIQKIKLSDTYVNPEDREILLRNIISTGRVKNFEVKLKRKDGTIYDCMLNVRLIDLADTPTLVTTYWDISERKRMQEKLEKEHKQFVNAIEALNHPFYVINTNDHTIAILNSATKQIFGEHSPSSRCYELTHQIMTPCSEKDHPCPLEEVKRTKNPVIVKHNHHDVEGKVRTFELHCHPIFDETGEVRQVIEYTLDITERKQMETDQERLFHMLTERIKELRCLYQVSKLVIEPSKTVETILQEVVEIIPSAWQYPDITSARITYHGQEFLSSNFNKSLWKQSADVFFDDEKIGTVEVYYHEEKPEEDEGPFFKEERELIDAIARDLGHFLVRHRTTQALIESEERYRARFESSPISLWDEDYSEVKNFIDGLKITDSKELEEYLDSHPEILNDVAKMVNLTDINMSTVKLYEGEHKYELLKGYPVIYHEAQSSEFKQLLLAFYSGESMYESELTDYKITGDKIHIFLTSAIVPGHEDSWFKVFTSITDLTALKRAREKLKKVENELQEKIKLAALGKLAAGVAHELNTPLANINLTVEVITSLIRQNSLDPNRLLNELHGLKSQIAHCKRIIENLMQFSRNIALKKENFDGKSLFRSILASPSISVKLREKRIRTILEVDKHVKITGDRELLQQVFQNIIINSIDAIDQSQNDPTIQISLLEEEKEVKITIIDNGKGIERENLPHIFEPFFTTKKIGTGTGLGLSIAHGIVEKHEGRIIINSILGEGVEVTVSLPQNKN